MNPVKDEINNELEWINPVGGLGDMLMVSGVLKTMHEMGSSRKFNLVHRTKYLSFFSGHPAIAHIGYPPKDSVIHGTNYWQMEQVGAGDKRPYQILSRYFGLPTPIEEKLYIADQIEDDSLLNNFLPWKKVNAVIAPASDSQRKEMPLGLWHILVDMMHMDGMQVFQVGMEGNRRVRNAYALNGITTPRQVIALLNKCDVVITSDSFIMHAAHMVGTKAVVLWGPTDNRVYGYPEQIHFQNPKMCDLVEFDECIGPDRNEGGKLYNTLCPLGPRHCMAQINPEAVFNSVKQILYNN